MLASEHGQTMVLPPLAASPLLLVRSISLDDREPRLTWLPPLPSGQGSQPSPTVASTAGRYPSPGGGSTSLVGEPGHLWLRGPVAGPALLTAAVRRPHLWVEGGPTAARSGEPSRPRRTNDLSHPVANPT